MKIVRFIFPFLFVRNWYDGAWEFSRMRFIIFGSAFLLVCLGIIVAYLLQSPVEYVAPAV